MRKIVVCLLSLMGASPLMASGYDSDSSGNYIGLRYYPSARHVYEADISGHNAFYSPTEIGARTERRRRNMLAIAGGRSLAQYEIAGIVPRVEGELAQWDIDGGILCRDPAFGCISNSYAYAGMLNLYGDYRMVDSPYTGYVGIGMGLARFTVNETVPASSLTVIDHDTSFAISLMTGFLYHANETLDLDLGLKYMRFSEQNYDVVGEIGRGLHTAVKGLGMTSLYMGLNYKF